MGASQPEGATRLRMENAPIALAAITQYMHKEEYHPEIAATEDGKCPHGLGTLASSI